MLLRAPASLGTPSISTFNVSRRLVSNIGRNNRLSTCNFIAFSRKMSHTHPSEFHSIVIGSGQGGTPLTQAIAAAGHKVALVESSHIGGCCINEGCTPTKTMVASARVAYLARRAADYGVHAGASTDADQSKAASVRVDMKTVRERKRNIVNSFRGGSEGRLEKAENVTLLRGKAAFTGPKTLEVTPMEAGSEPASIEADHIFINVGCHPAPLTIPVADGITILDSTSIMELDAVPEHLVVLGGGYVGLEFAQMFGRFGARVTVVQRAKQLLGREDEDVADAVRSILEEDGLDIMLGTTAQRIDKEPDGQLKIAVAQSGQTKTIAASHVLAVAGRLPNTSDLGLEKAGIKTFGARFVLADQKLRTNVEGVYAMGDVKGGPAFTHISYDDFRILRTNVLENGDASIAGRQVPYTVFMDPQLGRIGVTETEARSSGQSILMSKMPMSWVARALEMDESRGLMKVIVDKKSEKILGCAILGIEGGEVMSMIQIAMQAGMSYRQLRDGVFAHPGLAESLNNLFGYLK